MDKSVPAGAAILLDFIGSIEAPKGYDTVYGNNQAKLAKPLTSMTVAEVIAAGPSWTKRFGSSACGRYQFMKDTLKGLVSENAVSAAQVFSAETQDLLGYHLLKRRGYDQFMAARLGIAAFGLKLAQEWASFPVLKATKGAHRQVARGETYYAGDRLNKSLVPPERIEAVLAEALAAGSQPRETAPRKPATDRMAIPAGTWAEDTLAPFEIEAVQKRLRDLGYWTVGKVDGKWGPSTKGAIIALQATAGIEQDGHFGPQTKAALASDKNRRKVDPARAKTTAADLRAQGSVIAIEGNRVTWASSLGLVVALVGAAHAAWTAPADLPFGSSILLGLIPPPFGSIVSAVAPFLIAFLPLAYAVLAAQGIVSARVTAERTGLHNGEPDPAPSPPVTQEPNSPQSGGLFGSLFGAR